MKQRHRKQTGQKGFTLMELLVVLAILGLLMSLVGPQVLKQLAGVEEKFILTLNNEVEVLSVPVKGEEGLQKVNKEGKTSAVHFRKFVLPDQPIKVESATISCTHENYGHSLTLNAALIEELLPNAKD